MDEDTEIELLLVLVLRRLREKQKRKRNVWVKQIYRDREKYGAFHTLIHQLRLSDRECYFR